MKLIRQIPKERLGYNVYVTNILVWGTFNRNIDSIMYRVSRDLYPWTTTNGPW